MRVDLITLPTSAGPLTVPVVTLPASAFSDLVYMTDSTHPVPVVR